MGKSFKDEFTFEKRLEESQDNFAKYPLRIPISGSSRHVCWAIHSHFKQQASFDTWESPACVCQGYLTSNSCSNGFRLRIPEGRGWISIQVL